MGVGVFASTISDGVTPVCNDCGVALCWDISTQEYEQDHEFWDQWRCRSCNPNFEGALNRFREQRAKENAGVSPEQFTFFFSEKHPFSNWYQCTFEVRGLFFNCGEQYMMYAKARLFGDLETAEKILSAPYPKEQKRQGRQVKRFDQQFWDNKKIPIVRAGLIQKFQQNADLKHHLLATGNTTIVEASPYDRIWGAGLGEADLRKTAPHTWPGQNLLGKVLMHVRDDVRPESLA